MSNWDPNDYRIWVGNLGREVTEAHLESVFAKLSSFIRCEVTWSKLNGKSKGYGFVSYSDPNDFECALKNF